VDTFWRTIAYDGWYVIAAGLFGLLAWGFVLERIGTGPLSLPQWARRDERVFMDWWFALGLYALAVGGVGTVWCLVDAADLVSPFQRPIPVWGTVGMFVAGVWGGMLGWALGDSYAEVADVWLIGSCREGAATPGWPGASWEVQSRCKFVGFGLYATLMGLMLLPATWGSPSSVYGPLTLDDLSVAWAFLVLGSSGALFCLRAGLWAMACCRTATSLLVDDGGPEK
jgi:hypothetical protein